MDTKVVLIIIVLVLTRVEAVDENVCEEYRMSDAEHQTALEGVYQKLHTSMDCNSKPTYEMYSARESKKYYLFYLNGGFWAFSDTKCGGNYVIRSSSSDLYMSTPNSVNVWEERETTYADWVPSYGLSVKCISNYVRCYSCFGTDRACMEATFIEEDRKTYCDVFNGFYCWQNVTTLSSGTKTAKRECKQGCPTISINDFHCEHNCVKQTCTKCCKADLCNDDSMTFATGGFQGCSITQNTASTICYPYCLLQVLVIILYTSVNTHYYSPR